MCVCVCEVKMYYVKNVTLSTYMHMCDAPYAYLLVCALIRTKLAMQVRVLWDFEKSVCQYCISESVSHKILSQFPCQDLGDDIIGQNIIIKA